MIVLGIDPGPKQSAYVIYDSEKQKILQFGKIDNERVIEDVMYSYKYPPQALAIEMIASYGMAVGAEVFETCVMIGEFIRQAKTLHKNTPSTYGTIHRVLRRDVRIHVCNSIKANDSNIRAALIDRYGGKALAVGKKASPGPLFGVSKDVWAALALTITFAETRIA